MINIDPTKKKIYENRIEAMVGQELQKHYGGWRWYVDCALESGVVSVRNLDLNGEYGFNVPLTNLLNETDPKIIRTAGGEILERYNMDRTYRKQFDITRDYKGDAVGDING